MTMETKMSRHASKAWHATQKREAEAAKKRAENKQRAIDTVNRASLGSCADADLDYLEQLQVQVYMWLRRIGEEQAKLMKAARLQQETCQAGDCAHDECHEEREQEEREARSRCRHSSGYCVECVPMGGV